MRSFICKHPNCQQLDGATGISGISKYKKYKGIFGIKTAACSTLCVDFSSYQYSLSFCKNLYFEKKMNNINLYKIVVEWVLFIIQQLTDY